MTLQEKVENLFKNRSVQQNFNSISKNTGLGTSWLSAFSQGKIKSASGDKLEKLYEYFTGSPLEL